MRGFKTVCLMVVAALLTGGPATADASEPTAAPVVAAEDLQADVDVLGRAFRTLHPGLNRYLGPAQVDSAFGALRSELATPRTLAEAYLSFAVFAAKIRCGHTYPNFYNQSREVQQQVLEQSARLPFYFRWLGERMVVIRDFTKQGALPPGTEVLRVNGDDTRAILARLMTLARADGANDAKRTDQLAVTGAGVYEPFDVYFPMLFGLPPGSVRLTVRAPGNRSLRVVTVEALSHAERIAPISARESARRGGRDALFEWRDLGDGIAYLGMRTWALYDSQWDWRGWLNARLGALAATGGRGLIVDLRGNEGGDDVGDVILAHLITADLALDGFKRLVRYRAVPKDVAPYLKTWDPGFKDWGAAATELDEPWPTAPPVHYFALNRAEGAPDVPAVIHPAAPRFTGKVVVLVDASNSSATFRFADIVQRHGLGTLVGQPTGGNRRGINGGAFFFLRLPRSGIELDLPLIGTFPPRDEPDAGLIPDVPVQWTGADVASGTDPELSAAQRLLRGHR